MQCFEVGKYVYGCENLTTAIALGFHACHFVYKLASNAHVILCALSCSVINVHPIDTGFEFSNFHLLMT